MASKGKGIDRFSKSEFEAQLPRHKDTREPLWRSLGQVQGQELYGIEVKPWVRIVIYSTIAADGWARMSGEDSIRLVLQARIPTGIPATPHRWDAMTGGPDAWTTRRPGWSERLIEKIRMMWMVGREMTTEPSTGYVVRMAGTAENKSRPFQVWVGMDPPSGKRFEWLDRCPSVRVKYVKGEVSEEYKRVLAGTIAVEKAKAAAKEES